MENVIVFLLFLYFFLIRPVLRQLKRARDGGAKKPRSPLAQLLEKLQQKIRKVAEQAGAPSAGQARPAASWKDFFPTPQEPPVSPADAEPAQDVGELAGWREQPRFAVAPVFAEPRRETWAPATPPPLPPDIEPEPEAAAEERKPPAATPVYAGINLRQAVVWSEILGPPVALRGDPTPGSGSLTR